MILTPIWSFSSCDVRAFDVGALINLVVEAGRSTCCGIHIALLPAGSLRSRGDAATIGRLGVRLMPTALQF